MRAVVLVGHGSRDPAWRAAIDAVAARAQALAPGVPVACAFLELQGPTVAEAAGSLVAQGASRIDVFPLFLGLGRHAREDLPRAVTALAAAHPKVAFRLRPSAGEEDRVLDLLAKIAVA
jgi:sirohydrochlorin cobaltochelatase